MSEDQLKALQEELAALRSRTKRRSFKQVLKDANKKFCKIMNTNGEDQTFQEFVVLMFLTITGLALLFAILILAAVVVKFTKGLVLLLIPAYTLYYLVKKDTNGSDS